MKPKPVSHKTENTYRFLTFAERLGNVNIDIIHRIDRTASYDEEVETYFFEGLLKWRELNLTEHFGKFYKEVIDKCQSFNQLVYHQNEIVQSLKTHLQIKNSYAYQPLLDLVVQLARDLQTDFYPHFQDFSDHHLNPGDSGHGVVRMGFHLSVISVQVPLETDGERHVQYIQHV